MPEKNGKKRNATQDIAIAQIQKDIEYIKLSIDEIKNNHLKGLNSEVETIKKELNARPTWAITFLTALSLSLITFVLANYFVK